MSITTELSSKQQNSERSALKKLTEISSYHIVNMKVFFLQITEIDEGAHLELKIFSFGNKAGQETMKGRQPFSSCFLQTKFFYYFE